MAHNQVHMNVGIEELRRLVPEMFVPPALEMEARQAYCRGDPRCSAKSYTAGVDSQAKGYIW